MLQLVMSLIIIETPLLDMTMIYDIYAFLLLYLQNAGEKLFGERKKMERL